MSGALTALSAVTFALGIAAGNGPRLIAATRGAAQAWQPRRAPAPFTHLMEGITIMSADNYPGHRPAGDDQPGMPTGLGRRGRQRRRRAVPGRGPRPRARRQDGTGGPPTAAAGAPPGCG